ncbi:MAG: YgcG family protein [Ignavibacteriales bacterium]|nr:YgcG family protein [Ignavibacteriales bacterium]
MKIKYLIFLFLTFLIVNIFGQELQRVPDLWQRVTDLTNTLALSEIDSLDSKLFHFEKEKGSQIAVLIIPTTQPETIEEYSIRVAEQWKIGREGIDDGVILIVAINDRTLRIEVGYGLEGIIPDATAKSIIDNIIVPYFKSGDIYLGIDKGVDALISYIRQEPLPQPTYNYDYEKYYEPFNETLFIIIMAFIIISGIVAPFIFGQLWGRLGSLILAILLGLIFYDAITMMSFVIMNLFFSLCAIPGGTSGSGGSYRPSSSSRSYSSGSSYRSSSYSSSGSSRSSFSGGGGSFGGGGASGRW